MKYLFYIFNLFISYVAHFHLVIPYALQEISNS